ncbi:MAG: ABC transporter ATP-binding protein [Propionicimonas sp.]|nr:ABC transporter ATP-binding protein [Propionicimonas sp.]
MREAVPGWVPWCQAAISWVGAAATALLFWRLGVALDGGGAGQLWLLLGLVVVAAGAAAGGAWFTQWASSGAERELRQGVVAKAFDLGVVGTDGRSGELLSLATTAVEKAASYRAGFLGPIVGSLTTPFLVLGVMALTVDPAIAGWLALLVLVVPLLVGGFQRLVSPVGAAYRRTQTALTSSFLEAIQALDTLVYARAADRAAADLARRGEDHRRQVMRLLAGNQVLIFVVDAAFSLAIVVAAAGLALGRIGAGDLTLGQAIAILLMTVLVVAPVDVIGQFFYIGISGRASVRQLRHHLATPSPHAPFVRSSAGNQAGRTPLKSAQTGGSGGAGIVLEEVTAGWTDGAQVLERFSLDVEPGEKVALVGPTGVGKSTVSALVQAHLLPSSGRVLVAGHDTSATDPGVVRSQLAVVEQRTFLFLGTIAENLRIAAPDATDTRLWEALDLAGLRADVEAMPEGLASQVGEHGRLLSGGQAQRLAIARAALRDAPILVLDEPTSQVDLAAEAAILAALARLAAGRTVLMIAHRPGAILAADRVVTLADSNKTPPPTGPMGTVPSNHAPEQGSAATGSTEPSTPANPDAASPREQV